MRVQSLLLRSPIRPLFSVAARHSGALGARVHHGCNVNADLWPKAHSHKAYCSADRVLYSPIMPFALVGPGSDELHEYLQWPGRSS